MRNLGLAANGNSKVKSPGQPAISTATAAATDAASLTTSTAAPSSSMGPDGNAGQEQQQQQEPTPDDKASSIRAAAAAALAAAKEGASGGVVKSYNKVTVTETRRFAGQDIQVSTICICCQGNSICLCQGKQTVKHSSTCCAVVLGSAAIACP